MASVRWPDTHQRVGAEHIQCAVRSLSHLANPIAEFAAHFRDKKVRVVSTEDRLKMPIDERIAEPQQD